MDDVMSFETLKQFEIDKYIDLMRIKRCQKENNAELEYQLKTQKNKLNVMGLNVHDFEFDE